MTAKRAGRDYPSWLKKRIPAGPAAARVRDILSGLRLNTVCGSALCPNMAECFHNGTATFLIMGPNCTRNCSFCAVDKAPAAPLDPSEPGRVAEAAVLLGLRHAVVTCVTRDDLPDGGAAHFAATITAIRKRSNAAIEVLTSDFGGSKSSVETVVAAGPDVFNHNVETVPRLYAAVRPQADYARSLEVLRIAGDCPPTARGDCPSFSSGKRGPSPSRFPSPSGLLSEASAKERRGTKGEGTAASRPRLVTKSGIMLALGETLEEVESVFADLRAAGVSIVTAGQYLCPSKNHIPVARHVTPAEFEYLQRRALEMGFTTAFCAPFVRSSYHAGEVFSGM